MWGDVVAAASTVTAAFARKLHAAFACKGSNYGGDGGGGGGGGGGRRRAGGSQERFVLGGDRIPDRGAVSWCMRLPPRADIPSARRRRYRWERWEWWERWGWWECWEHWKGKLVVGKGGCLCGDGSVWKSFSHPKSFHGNLLYEPLRPHHPPWKLVFADPNLNAQSLHFEEQPLQTRFSQATTALSSRWPRCMITAITRFRSDWGVDQQKGDNERRCCSLMGGPLANRRQKCSLMDWSWVAFTNGRSIIEHPLSARLPRPLANIH